MRTSLALALSLASAPLASAQAPFADYSLVNPSIGEQFASLDAIDLDLDGDMDVVTGDVVTQRLVWYENLGDGSMEPGVELSRNLGTYGAAVVDLDLDGLPDLCFSRFELSSSSVHWVRNLGGGEFAAAAPVSTNSILAGALRAEDLDADGDIDLLIHGQGGIVWLDGQGSGVVANPVVVWSSPNAEIDDLVIEDFTGDGLPDIVFGWAAPFDPHDVELLPQLPAGGFGAPQLLQSGVSDPRNIVLYDADLDGDRDILLTSGVISWLRFDGSGQFAPQVQTLLNLTVVDLLATDLDNDGDEDLLYSANSGQSTDSRIGEIFLQAPLSFALGQELTDVSNDSALLVRADLNQDGFLDLLHRAGVRNVRWFPSVMGTAYDPPVDITDRALSGNVALVDVDLDGLRDAVVLRSDSQWYRRQPSGTYDRSVTNPAPGFSILDARPADLNGDGHVDILSTYFGATSNVRELHWTPGGPAGFGPATLIDSYTGDEEYVEPVAIDLDQDGDLDVVSTSNNPLQISTYENLGGGAFGARVDTPLPLAESFLEEPADLTGDGLADIVIRSRGVAAFQDRIYVSENLGNGELGPFVLIGQNVLQIRDVDYTDIDQDGDLDLVVAQDTDGNIREVVTYRNNGGLSFGQAATLFEDFAIGFGYQIEVADWNQDGLQDFVVHTNNQGAVFLHLALGPGQLSPREHLVDLESNQGNIFVTDHDGDLDPDLVFYSSSLDALFVYANERTLGETYCTSLPNSTGATAVLTGSGSPFAAFNGLALRADQMPPGVFGFFLNSMTAGVVQQPGNSQGVLCLGGDIGRYNQTVLMTDAAGSMGLTLDLAATPTPSGFVSAMAGQTWHFQGWFRDTNPSATSNFTNGLRILID